MNMTNKEWNDWKENPYATRKIVLNEEGQSYLLKEYGQTDILEHSVDGRPDRILDAAFANDQVILKVVKWTNGSPQPNRFIQTFYMKRKHIECIEYK